MAEISLSKTVNAPAGQVWASWDDFGNIYKFNPGIAASKLLSDCDAAPRWARAGNANSKMAGTGCASG